MRQFITTAYYNVHPNSLLTNYTFTEFYTTSHEHFV